MATDDTAKKIDEILREVTRSTYQQTRASEQLSEAMKELGSKAVDVLTKNLKEAAKNAGILSEDQLSVIRTTKDLQHALEVQEKRIEKLSDAAHKRYTEELEEIKQSKDFTRLGKKYQDQILADADKKHAADMQEIKDLQMVHEVFDDTTERHVKSADSLDKFTNWVSRGTNALKGWAAKTFTLTNTIEAFEEAANQAIGELNKATSVGLQDSLLSINKGAMHLNMTFDEFSDVISKNRDVVRQLGSGTKGIESFTDVIHDASKGLAYMGREGNFATATFIETMKTMGTSVKSKSFQQSITGMQKHFSEFSALYGDNYEVYADLIGTQFKSATIQARLNGLDEQQRAALQEEIIQRTENNKNMGLSNEQIKEFNDKISALYDPHKANIAEKVKGAELSKTYLAQLAADSGDAALKEILPQLNAFLDYTKGATDEQVKTMSAALGKAGVWAKVGAARATLTQKQEAKATAALEGHGDIMEAATAQLPENIMQAMSTGTGDLVTSLGDTAYQAKVQNKLVTKDQEARGKEIAAAQVAGDVNTYVEAIKDARDIQQSYNAIMDNTITKGFTALGIGLGTAIMNLGKFSKLLGMIGGGGAEAAGAAGGGAGLAEAAGLGSAGLGALAAAGTAGVGGLLYSPGAGAGSDKIAPPPGTKLAFPNLAPGETPTPGANAPPGTVDVTPHLKTLADETKRGNDILSQIAQNTSYKPSQNSAMYKQSPTEVANRVN